MLSKGNIFTPYSLRLLRYIRKKYYTEDNAGGHMAMAEVKASLLKVLKDFH